MKDSLRRLSLVLALACFGGFAAGCVGSMEPLGEPGDGNGDGDGDGNGNGDGTGGGQTAQQLFDAEVKGIVQTACGVCHAGTGTTIGPAFLGADSSEFYAKITADTALLDLANPANSKLVTYQHLTAAQGVFDATQKPKVIDWITKYAAEKSGT